MNKKENRNPENDQSQRRRTSYARAETKSSWWPGWIWSVPVAALGIGVWLLIRSLSQGGTCITITFDDAQGMTPGDTAIVYRGMKVGQIDDLSLGKNGHEIEASATIIDSASQFLRSGTIFWLRGVSPSLSNLSSLGAVLSGPTVMMEPGTGEKTTTFQGISHRPAIPPGHGQPVLFRILFDGAVGDLAAGDPVKLRGFPVGEVHSIGFNYNAQSGAITTPVTVALYPPLFHIEGTKQPESATALKNALGHLVAEGVRARLEREPPLIGSYRVALETVKGAPSASLDMASQRPEIPTAPGGGLQSIVNRFKNVPIDQIGQNLLDISRQIDKLASSPQLKDSITQLDKSLQEIHQTLEEVSPKLDNLVQTLRETAAQLQRASASVDQTLGGPASQTGLQDTLREMKDAARSVRSLADYLERHPESLISGKPGR